MIHNPYNLGNPPLTFSNTIGLMAYLFLNMVSTRIVVIRGNQGVQASMMIPLITIPIGNMVPYFQSPIWNPPPWVGNSRGGIPTRGGGSPLMRVEDHKEGEADLQEEVVEL
jgi:hypothetical protein